MSEKNEPVELKMGHATPAASRRMTIAETRELLREQEKAAQKRFEEYIKAEQERNQDAEKTRADAWKAIAVRLAAIVDELDGDNATLKGFNALMKREG
jgi:hypothetical protein